MKKFLLFSLVAIMAVFALSACSDSGDDNGGGQSVTSIDPSNPTTLLGVYDIKTPAMPQARATSDSIGQLYLNIKSAAQDGGSTAIQILISLPSMSLNIPITRHIILPPNANLSQLLASAGVSVKDGSTININIDPFMYPEVAPLTVAFPNGIVTEATKVADINVGSDLQDIKTEYEEAPADAPITAISGKDLTIKLEATPVPTPIIIVTTPASAVRPTMTFTSNDPSIATVDSNGLVTPVALGETTIAIEADGVTPININVTVELPVVPTISDPETLVGTYNVNLFATVAMDAMVITNDCENTTANNFNKNSEGTAIECDVENMVTIHGGQVVISKVNGEYQIESKLQMSGGYLALAPDDIFQYNKYSALPATAFTAGGANMDNAVKGVSGRNLINLSNNPESTFKITENADGTFLISLVLKNKIANVFGSITNVGDAPTFVIAEKISGDAVVMNPNTLIDTTVAGFDGFKTTPEPELVVPPAN